MDVLLIENPFLRVDERVFLKSLSLSFCTRIYGKYGKERLFKRFFRELQCDPCTKKEWEWLKERAKRPFTTERTEATEFFRGFLRDLRGLCGHLHWRAAQV